MNRSTTRRGSPRIHTGEDVTIPGVDYYSALAIVAEIGDIRRFPTKAQLCSLAGVVPRADNSGAKVSQHRSVKRGDMVLKRFLCIAVQGRLRAKRDTTIKRFYAKKAKAIGAPEGAGGGGEEAGMCHLVDADPPRGLSGR